LGQNQYSRHVFLREENTVEEILETGLVAVDARTTLPEVSRLLMSRPTDQLYDPFIITYHGEYYGVATVKAVMDGIAFYEQKDIAAAREAQQAMNSPKKKQPRYLRRLRLCARTARRSRRRFHLCSGSATTPEPLFDNGRLR
jgi:predicted RNase H-like nuclease